MVHTRSKMAATSSSATVSPSPMDKKGSVLKTFSPIPDSLKETTLDSGIMDNDYPSILTAKDLALLCTQNDLDPNLPIRLPEGDEQLDWYSENWATLCIDYFPLRKVVPLPKLILELCLKYDLAPSQLMPSLWLIILCVEELCEKLGLAFTLSDLMNCYNIQRKHRGLYTLHSHNKQEPLVFVPADLDKRWRSRFVFVHKSALVEPGVKLRTQWVNLGKKGLP